MLCRSRLMWLQNLPGSSKIPITLCRLLFLPFSEVCWLPHHTHSPPTVMSHLSEDSIALLSSHGDSNFTLHPLGPRLSGAHWGPASFRSPSSSRAKLDSQGLLSTGVPPVFSCCWLYLRWDHQGSGFRHQTYPFIWRSHVDLSSQCCWPLSAELVSA